MLPADCGIGSAGGVGIDPAVPSGATNSGTLLRRSVVGIPEDQQQRSRVDVQVAVAVLGIGAREQQRR